ncbi:hypothetical protein V6Z11_D04G148800 [Gossypium hirsutum]
MSRRGTAKDKTVKSDPNYPYQFIYQSLKNIQKKKETNQIYVLSQATSGVTPDIVIKGRCIGGSTHQVPIEIGSIQGKALAIGWLLGVSRNRPMDAAKGSGDTMRKKE